MKYDAVQNYFSLKRINFNLKDFDGYYSNPSSKQIN